MAEPAPAPALTTMPPPIQPLSPSVDTPSSGGSPLVAAPSQSFLHDDHAAHGESAGLLHMATAAEGVIDALIAVRSALNTPLVYGIEIRVHNFQHQTQSWLASYTPAHVDPAKPQAANCKNIDRMVSLMAPGCVYVNDPVRRTCRGPTAVRAELEASLRSVRA